MSEKKSKEVKMEGKQEKLTYEQLEQIAGNLQQQCQQLYSQLKDAQNTIAEFNEIGLLLDILAKSEHFSEDFIYRCSKKVEDIITRALDAADEQDKKKETVTES
jgi:hypothetical protein